MGLLSRQAGVLGTWWTFGWHCHHLASVCLSPPSVAHVFSTKPRPQPPQQAVLSPLSRPLIKERHGGEGRETQQPEGGGEPEHSPGPADPEGMTGTLGQTLRRNWDLGPMCVPACLCLCSGPAESSDTLLMRPIWSLKKTCSRIKPSNHR